MKMKKEHYRKKESREETENKTESRSKVCLPLLLLKLPLPPCVLDVLLALLPIAASAAATC